MIEPHAQYLALGRDADTRRAAYRVLFGQTLSDAQLRAIRDATRSSLPYGSEEFVSALERALGRRLRLSRAPPRARLEGAPADCVPEPPII